MKPLLKYCIALAATLAIYANESAAYNLNPIYFSKNKSLQQIDNAQSPSLPPSLPGYIEGGMDYHSLNKGYGTWLGEYFAISKQTDEKNTWAGEIHHQREFGEQGTFVGLTNTHIWNDDWYTTAGIGTSDQSFFWQRFSLNAAIYHKMLSDKQLIPYLGYQEYWWRTDSKSIYLNPGLIYYFSTPWVLEGGLLLQRNEPGQVDTVYKYVSLTQGEEKKHYVTARFAWGREGYLAVGPTDIVQNFPSTVITMTWRQWLSPSWGFNLVGETYFSRVYNRNGVALGIFTDI